jgi:hypothetical protein
MFSGEGGHIQANVPQAQGGYASMVRRATSVVALPRLVVDVCCVLLIAICTRALCVATQPHVQRPANLHFPAYKGIDISTRPVAATGKAQDDAHR